MIRLSDKFKEWQQTNIHSPSHFEIFEAAWDARQSEIAMLRSEVQRLQEVIREKNQSSGLG